MLRCSSWLNVESGLNVMLRYTDARENVCVPAVPDRSATNMHWCVAAPPGSVGQVVEALGGTHGNSIRPVPAALGTSTAPGTSFQGACGSAIVMPQSAMRNLPSTLPAVTGAGMPAGSAK